MMTSINPKNVNLNNMRQNEADSAPNQINNLFQRNNYGIEKGGLLNKEAVNNNLNYNRNLNINQGNLFKNINSNSEMIGNNLNYNNQNNSINLNLGLQAKKITQLQFLMKRDKSQIKKLIITNHSICWIEIKTIKIHSI